MTVLFLSQNQLTVLLVSAVIFVNGWTDAPNAVATSVASGAIRARKAVNFAALFNFLGLFTMALFNNSVARGIEEALPFTENSQTVLCSAMLSIVSFAVFAWYFGIPTSESHALVAAISGSTVAVEGKNGFDIGLWVSVIAGMAITSAMGFSAAFIGKRLLRGAEKRLDRGKINRLQIAAAMLMSYIHGAQDGQKFSAVMFFVVSRFIPQVGSERMTVTFFCALLLAAGTALGGMRIIKKVGTEITDVDEIGGICCDAAAFAAILPCTLFGIPVSTTHTKTTAVLGVGAADGNVRFRPFLEILSVWILTFPCCFVLGYLITLIAK